MQVPYISLGLLSKTYFAEQTDFAKHFFLLSKFLKDRFNFATQFAKQILLSQKKNRQICRQICLANEFGFAKQITKQIAKHATGVQVL